MTARIMDGSATAAAIREKLAAEVNLHVQAGARKPGLAVLLVGDDPASHIYVKNKITACKKTGIESWLFQFAADASPAAVLDKIRQLNADDTVDGILVQLPLPKQFDTDEVLSTVSAQKDADGLHSYNLGLLTAGKRGPRPCTPLGIIRLLEHYEVDCKGKKAVVIGRSNLVGKPIALMLLEKHATVTICHSRSQNLECIAREADILIAAAGQPHLVKGSWIKPGAVVVDVGIHRQAGDGPSKIVGDVDFQAAAQVASLITPVPGGIGPMTIAMLLCNTFDAYKRKLELRQAQAIV